MARGGVLHVRAEVHDEYVGKPAAAPDFSPMTVPIYPSVAYAYERGGTG